MLLTRTLGWCLHDAVMQLTLLVDVTEFPTSGSFSSARGFVLNCPWNNNNNRCHFAIFPTFFQESSVTEGAWYRKGCLHSLYPPIAVSRKTQRPTCTQLETNHNQVESWPKNRATRRVSNECSLEFVQNFVMFSFTGGTHLKTCLAFFVLTFSFNSNAKDKKT